MGSIKEKKFQIKKFKNSMKQRFLFRFLAVSILILAIAIASFYWLNNKPSPNAIATNSNKNPTGALFVPKNAPLMASLLVNPQRLQSLGENLGLPPRQWRRELDRLQNTLFSNTGIDYKRDIQSWIGEEITLAVTTPDIDRQPSNGKQKGILIAVATKNPQLSREFLQLFWQRQAVAGVNLTFETYKGVKLIYIQSPQPNRQQNRSLASAIVGEDFVLFANHPKVLRDALDNVQAPGLNIYFLPNFAKAIANFGSQTPTNAIGSIFVNLGEWDLNVRDWDSLVANQPKVGVSLKFNRQGLVVENALLIADGEKLPAISPLLSESAIDFPQDISIFSPPDGKIHPGKSTKTIALDYIPVASSLVAASTDLQSLWSQVSAILSENSWLSNWARSPLVRLKSEWGLDLAEDIFSWVKGEYALALLPKRDRSSVDWIFVTERSPEITDAIARLDAIAAAAGYTIGSFSLEINSPRQSETSAKTEKTVSAWTRLTTSSFGDRKGKDRMPSIQAQAKALHATVGKYEIFASSVAAMDEALNASTRGTVLEREDFQNSIAVLPQSNNGYLYLDWQTNREFFENQFQWVKVAELWNQLFFDSWRSLTFTSTGGETAIRRSSAIFFFSS